MFVDAILFDLLNAVSSMMIRIKIIRTECREEVSVYSSQTLTSHMSSLIHYTVKVIYANDYCKVLFSSYWGIYN